MTANHQTSSQHAIGQNQTAKHLRHHVTSSACINTGVTNRNTATERTRPESHTPLNAMIYIMFCIITYYRDGQYNILFRAQQRLVKKNQSDPIRLRVRRKEAFLPSAVVVHTNVYKAGRNGIKYCFQVSQKAGSGTLCAWKMLIIPPPLAAALHRSGHMLLYKLFTYNGGLYWAATRLFTIQIKCLDFHPPRAKGGICVDTKGLRLAHYLLCRAASEGNFWPEPLRSKWVAMQIPLHLSAELQICDWID